MTHDKINKKRNPISYSIWLMPSGNKKDQFSKMINAISHKYGGPLFDPHVTLVSGFLGNEVDLLKDTQELSRKISSFEIIFEKISYLDEYFRSIFFDVKYTDELKEARNIACKKTTCSESNYRPHMSLTYGNYNLSTKLKMVSEIDEIPNGFLTDKIFLAYNDEVNLHWEIIDYFDLSG